MEPPISNAQWEQKICELLMVHPTVSIVIHYTDSKEHPYARILISYSPRSLDDKDGWWIRHFDKPHIQNRYTSLDVMLRVELSRGYIQECTGWGGPHGK